MIQSLSTRYQSAAAWLLFFVFYLQLAAPLAATVNEHNYFEYGTPQKLISIYNNDPFIKNYNDLSPLAIKAFAKKSFADSSSMNGVNKLNKKPILKPTNGPGPGQPEMQTFQSVNSSNMVDLFTGDFSYNIPLLDVGGYPVNIHYTGGISMDQEASWVGLGWNINPGTISRSMRGIPDDFNGQDSIARTQHVKPNKTAGVTVGGDFELGGLPLNVDASIGVFQNNYKGWGLETGINAAINAGTTSLGPLTAGLSLTNNSQTGINVSPSLSIDLGTEQQTLNGRSTLSTNYNSRTGISALQLTTEIRSNENISNNISHQLHLEKGSFPISASLSFAVPSYTPTISMPYTSTQYAFTVKLGSSNWIAHPNVYADGYVSEQEIKPADTHQSLPAFGYLYYSLSNNQPNALLDMNREKETQFNYSSTPMLAIPQYTYDIYSISGEGTGGMFRPYRGEIGYVRDHAMKTKSSDYNASVDIGIGDYFHLGADFIPTIANTQNSGWENPGKNAINSYIKFQKSDSSFQEVYFRNPGEKTSNTLAYYNSVGNENLMRIKLSALSANVTALNAFTLIKNNKEAGEIAVNTPPVKLHRDKRTQVITYLTAGEAGLYGLDKTIKSYAENTIPLGNCTDTFSVIPRYGDGVRKKHHISEIDVTNADGRRYVYGLPAYNVEQKDVTFSVSKETDTTTANNGLAGYVSNGLHPDNSINNAEGKDNYYTQDSMPGYAHDFLLTGVLSPDYVDITGDGITPDDLGDAVKFNYTRVYGPDNNYFDWRVPYQHDTANYNEGLKTDKRDDKGTYLYGKKEVWYLNSIESKTMIAVFKIKNDRLDGYAVNDENGGYNTSKGLRRLDQIDLYTKADLIANGDSAKPIKSVHFVYSYSLCKGFDSNSPGTGKLTLDSIWFSYNANYKGRINPYVFHYSPDANGNPQTQYNPSYNPKNYDRWGNFKDSYTNPGNISNVDYPYSIQDSTIAAQNASAWELTDIQLPSFGRLKITYESDDYAYVQNRRAMQMFQIAGFGNSASSTPVSQVYTNDTTDNYYLFVNTNIALADTGDLRRKFFGNNDTVFFKIAVQMPADIWGSGYEFVPGYGVVSAMGLKSSTQFWIKFQSVNGESPITRSALQFLRLNLPSKAYPGSEIGNDLDFSTAIKLLATSFTEIKNVINGFDNQAMVKGECQQADLSRSFIRLTSPTYKKYGGGLRVKRVELFDNWNKMTGQKEASFGQDYTYTTTEEINGQVTTISSGVASYEPAIGNEENPFHEPIEYAEKLAPLAPVNYMFVEAPVCESFYPSASVGYSKVTVRTINQKAKSANGWDETCFYTTKDFPTLVDYSTFDNDSKKRYNTRLRALLKINAEDFVTLSQGFKVELNDMNGKMKSQASYPETDSLHPVRASYYYYKTDNPNAYQLHLNNTVPLVDSLNGHINENGIIGEDIEVMSDLRQQSSKTISRQFSPNVDVIMLPFFGIPFPIPSFWPLPQIEQTKFNSAALVKVIQRYGILDSVVVIDKGSVVSTKNLVYDGETGDVIVSRTNNEFNDPVYNFNYPAYWAYSGMGPAYQNIGDIFYRKNLMCINGKLYNRADRSDFNMKKYFESGDELWIRSNGIPTDPNCGVYNPDLSGVAKNVWVIDAAKGSDNDKGLYLIDNAGVPYTGMIDSLKIIRSGKRNMIDASAGSITSLASPVREITPGNFKIVIDSNTQVLQTAATAYKDLWKVENSLYQADSLIQVYHTFTVTPAIDVTTFRNGVRNNGHGAPIITFSEKVVINSPNIGSSFEGVAAPHCHPYLIKVTGASIQLSTKSIISFDTSAIPTGAIILSAYLNLSPKVPYDLWFTKTITRQPCSDYNSYDWFHLANNYYYSPSSTAPLPSAKLSRLTASWNYQTPYTTFQITNKNNVGVDPNTYTFLDCKSLIQDMANDPAKYTANNTPKYSIMFELTKSPNGLSYLDFCADSINNVNSVNNSGCISDSKTYAAKTSAVPNVSVGGNFSCNCTPPKLTITYRALVDTIIHVCRSNIDSVTNPYRWGILGNWRPDRAYTYYYDRKESDATNPLTNIRKEGMLKNFTPYWQFTDSALVANPDTTKWVWNSALSMYNRKGFEIENYDPLGRYNSGLYGYNETLPVAVAQNSKYRQVLFDGFEDYSYKSSTCATCPSPREVDFTTGNSNVSISDTISHTGLYSLKINKGTQSSLTVPIVADTPGDTLSIKIDSLPVIDTLVVGKGTGITGTYYGCGNTTITNIDDSINFNWGFTAPFPQMCNTKYTVIWNGFVQAPSSDNFVFYGESGGTSLLMQITINGITLSFGSAPNFQTTPIKLIKGQIYPVIIQYIYNSFPFNFNSFVHLSWSNSTMPEQIVPKRFLYPQNIIPADTAGSVITTIKKWCVNAETVKQHNMVRPSFSPGPGDSMVLSAWVRIDAPDCNTLPSLPNVLQVSFNKGGAGSTVNLQPTGVRIEGWQRYESEVTIPTTKNLTSMYISAIAPQANNIFLDDVKMQPFHSSTKSFIYNPINLRLMAELDENNYATFYEYDDDGTLIRVKKETERGIMTIKETRSALIKGN